MNKLIEMTVATLFQMDKPLHLEIKGLDAHNHFLILLNLVMKCPQFTR